MEKVCLVGAGNVSKVYTEVLVPEVFELFYVDPKFKSNPKDRCYHQVAEIPEALASDIDFWVICTPTDQHVSTLREVLLRRADAKVLIEKPIVPFAHFDGILTLHKKYPHARILENCQYEQSSLVERVLGAAPEIAQKKSQMRGIYVEFTKNRIPDNRKGRFQDPDYLLVGYEGPHLIAVANTFVSQLFEIEMVSHPEKAICVDKNVPAEEHPDEGSVRFEVKGACPAVIELYTSMIGEIYDDRLMPARYSQVRRNWIFPRDRERYRVVSLSFDDCTYMVRFDPQKVISDGLLRNVQTIHKITGKTVEKIATLNFNIFSDAILGNFTKLSEEDYDTGKELQYSFRKAKFLEALAVGYKKTHKRKDSGGERREGSRLDAQFQVSLTLGDRVHTGTITDINDTGFQFECRDALPMGAEIGFEMKVESGAMKYRGRARVRWGRHFTFSADGVFCYGVKVVEWEGTTGEAIVKALLLD